MAIYIVRKTIELPQPIETLPLFAHAYVTSPISHYTWVDLWKGPISDTRSISHQWHWNKAQLMTSVALCCTSIAAPIPKKCSLEIHKYAQCDYEKRAMKVLLLLHKLFRILFVLLKKMADELLHPLQCRICGRRCLFQDLYSCQVRWISNKNLWLDLLFVCI